jgi:tetratricopeptide (TPR) repeat protein
MTAWLILLPGWVGCAQLIPPDSKQEAHDRWSEVRAELKYHLASDRFENGHLDEAYELVRESIGLNPNTQASYVLLTRILIERGEIALAAVTLSESLTYGSDTAETDYINGVIAERYRRFDDALKWYQQATTRDALNPHYVVAVAEMLVTLDRAPEALQLVKERWVDFEQSAALRALAGGIYMMLEEYEPAVDAYRQAHRIAPDDVTLAFQFGSVLMMAERYEEALTVLSDATKEAALVPSSIWLKLGQCQLALDQSKEAKQSFQRVVAEDPNNVRGWDYLARASLASGELLMARRAATKAVQLNPGHRDTLMLLGYVCYRQRDYSNAVTSFENVIRDDDEEPIALCLLGRSHEGLGNVSQAEKCYQRALRANPNCEWARQLLDKLDSTAHVEHDVDSLEGGVSRRP